MSTDATRQPMTLEACRAMPVGKVIEVQTDFLAPDTSGWNLIVIKAFEGELVHVRAHLYQTTWGPYPLHYSHFFAWRELRSN